MALVADCTGVVGDDLALNWIGAFEAYDYHFDGSTAFQRLFCDFA